MNGDKYQIDMCHGPLFGKIILFAMPLMFTYSLQLLFNAADLVVLGHYSTHEAMGAVGCTMNCNSFVNSAFIGLSIGINVLAARFRGAGDEKGLHTTTQTAMTIAFFGGIFLMIAALLAAKPILQIMKTPPDVLPKAVAYLRICFLAIPMLMVYNFGCAILRAVGDTRRPLYYLIIAGIVNVILNLFFVIGLGMDVDGVAIATAASHLISAILILRLLLKSRDAFHFTFREMSVDMPVFREILKIGIPAGIQSSSFALSNMTIQSSLNTFGSYALAGNTAALGLESIAYVGSFSFHQTAITFVSQNLGARKLKRIFRSIFGCYLCAGTTSLILGVGFYVFGEYLLAIFDPDPEVIRWGMIRMKVMFTTYFFCGFMDAANGSLRGLGYSLLSAVVCITGACLFRVFWVFCVFPYFPSMEGLLFSYPISWILVLGINTGFVVYFCRRLIHNHFAQRICWSKNGFGVPRGYRVIGSPK